MRIKVIRTPTDTSIDGMHLDRFLVGCQYEVGNTIGALFLAEGWATPVASDEPALLTPLSEFEADRPAENPANLIREFFPPYFDAPPALAADRRRRPRR
jgi:hypothetical protein